MALNIGELVGLIRADDRGMRRGLNDAELRMRGFQRDVEGRLRRLDGRFATLGEQIAAGLREGTDEGDRFSLSLGGIGGSVRGLVGVAGSIGMIGLKLGAAVPLAAGLAVAVGQIAPAAAVAVSALVAVQLATQTLKLAMVGVSDAVSAALDPSNPEAYAKALEKLSPNARAFVEEIKKSQPALDKLRRQVQDRVFAGLNVELRKTATSVLPSLRTALLNTGDSLNRMAKGAAGAARDLGDRGILGRALGSATTSMETMEKVPGRLVTSLGLLAAAAGPSLERIAKKVDEISVRIGERLKRAFDSGALERAIDGAIDVLAQLGRIGGNILGGLANIFRGVTTDGRGLFQILEDITQQFQELTASREFQIILSELVKTADSLVKNVLPLVMEAFRQLAPVIEELGPPVRDFIEQIGPALKPVLEELGPVLKDLAKIFREQLPFAIEVVKGALQVLAIALKALDFVLDEIVVPAVELVSDVLNSKYVKAIEGASRITTDRAGNMLSRFEEFRGGVSSAVSNAGVFLRGFVRSVSEWARGIADGGRRVVRIFTDLPGDILGALGNLGSVLWGSGRSLISGFISGIWSKIGEVANAASSVVSTARQYFPFSPAKKGAFSGKGWTLYSGQSISEALAAGIASRGGAVSGAVAGLMSGAQGALGGLGLPGAVTGTGAGVAGPQPVTLVVRSDGSRLGDLLTEVIRHTVRTEGGGDVQQTYGYA